MRQETECCYSSVGLWQDKTASDGMLILISRIRQRLQVLELHHGSFEAWARRWHPLPSTEAPEKQEAENGSLSLQEQAALPPALGARVSQKTQVLKMF